MKHSKSVKLLGRLSKESVSIKRVAMSIHPFSLIVGYRDGSLSIAWVMQEMISIFYLSFNPGDIYATRTCFFCEVANSYAQILLYVNRNFPRLPMGVDK